ncbi:MAG: RNA polymerase sigma factor, partial [Planctomycetota bacterium]
MKQSDFGAYRECRACARKKQCCRRGSTEAFEVLVNRYMKDAYFIALGLVGNREDAMDLSQEAFVRAYRNIKQVKPVSHLRKRKYRRAGSLDAENCPEVAATSDCFSPEAVAKRNETKDKVWQAIGKLDDKHREVIILRHFQNMSYEQIAA